jgi:hypothetical protein
VADDVGDRVRLAGTGRPLHRHTGGSFEPLNDGYRRRCVALEALNAQPDVIAGDLQVRLDPRKPDQLVTAPHETPDRTKPVAARIDLLRLLVDVVEQAVEQQSAGRPLMLVGHQAVFSVSDLLGCSQNDRITWPLKVVGTATSGNQAFATRSRTREAVKRQRGDHRPIQSPRVSAARAPASRTRFPSARALRIRRSCTPWG